MSIVFVAASTFIVPDTDLPPSFDIVYLSPAFSRTAPFQASSALPLRLSDSSSHLPSSGESAAHAGHVKTTRSAGRNLVARMGEAPVGQVSNLSEILGQVGNLSYRIRSPCEPSSAVANCCA